MKEVMNIEVVWSGGYPSLCSGEWKISINGKRLEIPKDRVSENMGTSGTYQSWHFEDWSEVFVDYSEGMGYEGWIEENRAWIDAGLTKIGVEFTSDDYLDLFIRIQLEDFRPGSCGGCL